MQLKLITPEKIFFEGEIISVQVPGSEGDFGVLPGHAPFISTIRPGVLTIDLTTGSVMKMIVVGGVAEVTPEQTIVLAEQAEDCSALSDGEIEGKLAAFAA